MRRASALAVRSGSLWYWKNNHNDDDDDDDNDKCDTIERKW